MFNNETENSNTLKKVQQLTDTFAKLEGRRPRILVTDMGKPNLEPNTKALAAGYADVGFDVDIAPLFQTPQEIAKQAIENDVHVVCATSFTMENSKDIVQLIETLKNYTRNDILVMVYSNMPTESQQRLLNVGVEAVMHPNTKTSDAATKILAILTN